MGMRPLGFLDSCSKSCHVIGPSREDNSLQVFSTAYNSLSLMPVKQEETTCLYTHTQAANWSFRTIGVSEQFDSQSIVSVLALYFGIKILTRGTNSQCRQGPAESGQVSVLRAQSFQAVQHQLVQGLRQSLEILFQLKTQVQLSVVSLGLYSYTVYCIFPPTPITLKCKCKCKPYQKKQSSSRFHRPAADRKDSLPPFSWSASGAGQSEKSWLKNISQISLCYWRIIVEHQNLTRSSADRHNYIC